MDAIPLTRQLAELIKGHGVACEVHRDMVYVTAVGRWASLWLRRSEAGTYLMELRATAEGQELVVDRWGALGREQDQAIRDGIEAFCRGGFHVFLAALWGVLELDQLDHEVRTVGTQRWDLYLGPYTGRTSAGVAKIVAPPALAEQVLDALDGYLTAGTTHALRVYLGVVDGTCTIETLVDDQPSDSIGALVTGAMWDLPAKGFASIRWFVIARRREGEAPCHLLERRCAVSS